ncbi:hypothetical protein R1flu_024365 [Riccia fluitans]|uniref:Tubulin epsilon and delta complex protein 1 domain-containing protein n=1 Tax=Riccia fluitans TaxID=41844 RepID=A0ABD1XYT2_9MARC
MKTRSMGCGDRLPTVSESLAYVCSLLSPLGISHLSPQHLLSAAANDPSASASMWSALHQLICFQLASPSSSKPIANVLLYSLQEADGDHASPDAVTTFVKFYLSLWGFPNNSCIFYLSYNTEESQNLLLALAWLISRCDIFKRAFSSRINKLLPRGFRVSPSDVSMNSEAVERARNARAKSENHIEKLVGASDVLPDIGLRARGRSQQTLALYGRVRMSLMALHSFLSARAKLVHKLNRMLRDLKVKDQAGHPFSQFDLHLCEHREILEKHFEDLEGVTHNGKEMELCEQHEKTFWQWMVSVVLSRDSRRFINQERGTRLEKLKVLSEFCIATVVPVVKYLKQPMMAQEKLMRFPGDSQPLELPVKNQVITLKKLSLPVLMNQEIGSFREKMHLRFHRVKFVLESAPSGGLLPTTDSTAESVLERLKLIAIALVQVLAQIRSRNRICVEEIMSKYATKDYVLHNF